MDEIKRKFDVFCNTMEKNTKGVMIGCYTIAFTGLALAIRKVRPFSKFKRPGDIPNLFIRERRELQGIVNRIDPNGALLMINHKPLVSLPSSTHSNLPVKIFGVNVAGHGISWLQAIVTGHEVKFVPILKKKNFVECEIILPQLRKELKNKVQMVNVGESLIGIGFGKIEPVDNAALLNKQNVLYYNKLKNAELQLQKKQLGVKYYIIPTKIILQSIWNNLTKVITRGRWSSKKLPKVATA